MRALLQTGIRLTTSQLKYHLSSDTTETTALGAWSPGADTALGFPNTLSASRPHHSHNTV